MTMERNKIQFYLVAGLLATACPFLRAQEKEEPLERELTLEKEYTPMVRDASKIYVLPGVEPPAVVRKEIQYSDWAIPADFTTALSMLPPAGFDTGYPFSRKRGYVRYGIGNYLNMSGNAGYHILDNDRDRLSVWYKYNSTDGNVKYTDTGEKTKRKFYDNQVSLSYKHRFRNFYLLLDGGYQHSRFNYYGRYTFDPNFYGMPDEDRGPGSGKDQIVQLYSVRGGIVSRPEKDIDYKLQIGYTGYSSKIGIFYGADGVKENHLTANLALSTRFSDFYRVGINGRLDNLFYGGNYDGENNTLIRLNPYFNVERDKLFFKAGLKMDITTNEGTIFRFAPDVKLDWQFASSFFLFSVLDGGKRLNTFEELFRITRYGNPSSRPADTYIPLDATAGIRSNYFNGFWWEVYAGYERLIDDYYFTNVAFGNVLITQALNDYRWKYGAVLKYNYREKIGVTAGIQKNDWKSGDRDFIPYRPDVELNAEIWGKWKDRLSVAFSYKLMSGLKYENAVDANPLSRPVTGKLKNVSLLNFRAGYNINEMFHVSLDLNNLLNRHYDFWYGMPAQRFNILGSVGINF